MMVACSNQPSQAEPVVVDPWLYDCAELDIKAPEGNIHITEGQEVTIEDVSFLDVSTDCEFTLVHYQWKDEVGPYEKVPEKGEILRLEPYPYPQTIITVSVMSSKTRHEQEPDAQPELDALPLMPPYKLHPEGN